MLNNTRSTYFSNRYLTGYTRRLDFYDGSATGRSSFLESSIHEAAAVATRFKSKVPTFSPSRFFSSSELVLPFSSFSDSFALEAGYKGSDALKYRCRARLEHGRSYVDQDEICSALLERLVNNIMWLV
ncbi:hypothetical protein IV203_002092 [Nitzschia inconspicua]|uniref:Uncharacterized protein n=1 Tax=Nitzschia inconspicua TaxID=303405 RepID=A0A9K3PUA9_9STRA|nr:hypothetical protein IV203_002092 [Nitzschia inconspicua]